MTLIRYCRYLEQITVRDYNTMQTWNFVCDNWLRPDDVDDVTMCTLKPTKHLPYRYTLRVKSFQSLRDQHLLLSIFLCPRHSTFTRVQRLSCGFALIISAMLVNIMFYRTKTSDIHDELIYDEMKLDVRQMVIGVQSALMTLPLSMLTVLIFRFVTPSDAKFEVRLGTDNYSKLIESSSDEDNNVNVNNENVYSQLAITNNNVDDNSSDGDSSFTNESDLDNENINDDNSDSNSDESDENNSIVLDSSVGDGSNGSSDSDSSFSGETKSGDLDNNESSASHQSDVNNANQYKPFRLPRWWVYIAWALTMSTCALSSYVVLMYGLTFGMNKSVAWLTSFLASTTNNFGIIQPLKVAIIVIIMTLLFKAPVGPVADITPRINIGKSLSFCTSHNVS